MFRSFVLQSPNVRKKILDALSQAPNLSLNIEELTTAVYPNAKDRTSEAEKDWGETLCTLIHEEKLIFVIRSGFRGERIEYFLRTPDTKIELSPCTIEKES